MFSYKHAKAKNSLRRKWSFLNILPTIFFRGDTCMTILIQAIEQQLNQSLYGAAQSTENKQRIATNWNRIKAAAGVIAFATPFFAFFFPIIFMASVSLTTGLIAYDLFNIADNLSDAARQSLQGFKPASNASQVEMMLESTLLANCIYQRIKA